MQKTAFTAALVAILAMALATSGFSQTTAKPEKPAGQPMMTPDKPAVRPMSMMDMSKDYEMINEDFAKIEAHLDQMVNTNDMKILKGEMKKHREMLTELRALVADHEKKCMMMHSSGASEMPGQPMPDKPVKAALSADSSRAATMQKTK